MSIINENLRKFTNSNTSLESVLLEIDKKVQLFQKKHPLKKIHRMTYGSTTLPLAPSVVEKIKNFATSLGKKETYMGYGSIRGNQELIETICTNYYKDLGVDIDVSEVFTTDGAQSATSSIIELFSQKVKVAVQDPIYPSFLEGCLISGKDNIVYLESKEENGFIPSLPSTKVDIIYLCFPSNPIGITISFNQLQKFVDYALENDAIIIYDAVYSEFIQDNTKPKSIYQLKGADRCAIEIHSFSKMANFAALRLGWIVIPQNLTLNDCAIGELNHLWHMRYSVKFWGASNLAQQAGIAALSKEGKSYTKECIAYYLNNANIIKNRFESMGFECFGTTDAPYIWMKTYKNYSSWKFFEYLLEAKAIVGIPGSVFGPSGEGYLRLSALLDIKELKENLNENN